MNANNTSFLRLAANIEGIASSWDVVKKLFEFGNWAREHPLPVALVATIAGWLLWRLARKGPAVDSQPQVYQVCYDRGEWFHRSLAGHVLGKYRAKHEAVMNSCSYHAGRTVFVILMIQRRDGKLEAQRVFNPPQ